MCVCGQIVDKARYDEDAEEWIIPYMKRKSIDALDSSRGGQLYTYNAAAIASSSATTTPNTPIPSISMLPDINLSSQYNKASLGLDKIENGANKASSSSSSSSTVAAAATAKKPSGKSGAVGRVPILTLPGGLTSASLLAGSELYSNRSDTAAVLQNEYTYSNNAYNNEVAGIGFDKEKRKKSSHGSKQQKLPKATNANAGNTTASVSARMNETQVLPASLVKGQMSGRSSSPLPSVMCNQIVVDEAGSGVAAGPLDEWDFASENSPSSNPRRAVGGGGGGGSGGKNNQEMEYSDDEDFETEESGNGQVPHPPLHGAKPPGSAAGAAGGGVGNRKLERKKKKKSKNATGEQLPANIGAGNGLGEETTAIVRQSPRVVLLPPIL